MPTIILKLLAPLLPYLAVAGIFSGGVLYVSHLRHSLAAADTANAVLMQTNQANLASIAAYQAQAQKWNAALDALGAQSLAASTAGNRIIDTISNAPASEDAPVAPVLANALADINKLQEQKK